jgi:hypothetical protein
MCDVRLSLTYYGLQLFCLPQKERFLTTVPGYVELIDLDPWPYIDQTSHFTTSSPFGIATSGPFSQPQFGCHPSLVKFILRLSIRAEPMEPIRLSQDHHFASARITRW